MGTIVILLLLVMAHLNSGHVIIAKEPPRYRLAYDDWKPVREGPIRHIRYPVYHKTSGYSFMPGKKITHQTAEQSEKVEVFSPAPPTILGSFSVFGHATVNAREHASHISKKSPRPTLTDFNTAESRPKVSSYQVRHQYHPTYSNYHHNDHKRPQYNEFKDQAYFYEASLRPPPHDSSKPYSNPSPSSYYAYDQGQNFPTEKYRKNPKVPPSPYRYPGSVYSQQLNEYKTTAPPNDYESTFSYYNSPSSIDSEYYNENPVGSVPLSIKRPESSLKPVTENDNVLDQLTHIGRPFQSPQTFTTVETIKGTLKPFVTTYPSSSTVQTRVKFSDVAQPFRISNYENDPSPSSKPETSHQTFREEMYPLSVTTIDVPTEDDTQSIKENDYSSNHAPFKPSPYDHSNHRIYKNSYLNENNNPVFLPTPSTDTSPYLSEPKSEITTFPPDSSHDYQESNFIPSVENKVIEPSEVRTEIYPTEPVETIPKLKPHKSRRPPRPTTTPASTLSTQDTEFKYQRRRKPSNKYRNRGTADKTSTYKRQRTTTTSTSTTTIPEVVEDSDLFTTVSSEIIVGSTNKDKYEYTGDRYENPGKRDYYEEKINEKYEDNEEGKFSILEAVPITGASSTSVITTTTTLPTTLPSIQTTSSSPTTTDTATRLKSKYGSRPRFSIKDYREKLNKATSTVAPHESERTKPTRNETEFKFGGRTRITTARTTTTTEPPESLKTTSESKLQKYKPRLGLSRYKTSTTQTPEIDTTTTERTNSFKPSTNRYKPGTGKYYSRYRTSTVPPKETDESPATTTPKITIRPKGVFSAKRQPFPLKTKVETLKAENNESAEDEEEEKYPESLKINENEVYSAVLKKMDDSATTTISSEEEHDEEKKSIEKDPTGQESLRIADLTSSSSNDFRQSSLIKSGASRRPLPKITLPTDNPILPLEAFFKTHS